VGGEENGEILFVCPVTHRSHDPLHRVWMQAVFRLIDGNETILHGRSDSTKMEKRRQPTVRRMEDRQRLTRVWSDDTTRDRTLRRIEIEILEDVGEGLLEVFNNEIIPNPRVTFVTPVTENREYVLPPAQQHIVRRRLRSRGAQLIKTIRTVKSIIREHGHGRPQGPRRAGDIFIIRKGFECQVADQRTLAILEGGILVLSPDNGHALVANGLAVPDQARCFIYPQNDAPLDGFEIEPEGDVVVPLRVKIADTLIATELRKTRVDAVGHDVAQPLEQVQKGRLP
jgi:hypothetical protein